WRGYSEVAERYPPPVGRGGEPYLEGGSGPPPQKREDGRTDPLEGERPAVQGGLRGRGGRGPLYPEGDVPQDVELQVPPSELPGRVHQAQAGVPASGRIGVAARGVGRLLMDTPPTFQPGEGVEVRGKVLGGNTIRHCCPGCVIFLSPSAREVECSRCGLRMAKIAGNRYRVTGSGK